MRRVALALLRGSQRPSGDPALPDSTGESSPRGYLFDEQFSRIYDESILEALPVHLRAIRSFLPPWMQLALEVHRRRDEYDAIVTWSQRTTLALTMLQTFSSNPKPHVGMMCWLSKPNIRLPLRLFGRSLHAIICWSSVQRDLAAARVGIPPEKLYLVNHWVDQVFWNPRPREVDMICAAGSEMRDYPTLREALRGTDIRCHIAADHVRVSGLGPKHRRLSADQFLKQASSNVTIGRMTPTELRELYARSRFVVIPLLPSDTDNGVTAMLEAMAMGKPVICSRTRGQVDVIVDGVNGLFVPPRDPVALRAAVLALWNDPKRAEAMGMRAREHVEKHHTLEIFCRDVSCAIEASFDGLPAKADGSVPAR